MVSRFSLRYSSCNLLMPWGYSGLVDCKAMRRSRMNSLKPSSVSSLPETSISRTGSRTLKFGVEGMRLF